MKQSNIKIVEKIKTILLVVLFFATVLLLYLFWENAAENPFRLRNFIGSAEVEEIPLVEDTVVPTEILVGFGNEVYTVIVDGREALWRDAVKELQVFGDAAGGQSANTFVGDITKEKYMEAMSYPSIQFQFNYDIPFSEFCDFFDIQKSPSAEMIESVSTVAYSALSKESILICQKNPERYFAIVADQDYTGFQAMIERIEAQDYASYYTAATIFGSGVSNSTLLPLALQSDLVAVPYEKESERPDADKVKDLAESFFGESFDFIRKTTDVQGNVTYMYGYGKKVFTVYANGTFEYKEELQPGNGEKTGFFASLDIAQRFVAAHGSWNSLDGTDMTAYLRKVVPVQSERQSGYKFIFGMKIGSQNVYFQKSAPIIVEVVGGQVTHYRRDMIDMDKRAVTAYNSGELEATFDPVAVLTENYAYIYEQMTAAGITLPPMDQMEETFDQIAEKITAMEIGYVRSGFEEDGREMELLPCYRISFGKNVSLYFDLFNDAAPISSESEE